MDNLPLDDLSLFSAVAEAGSIVGAARRLRQPKSTVSRRLQVLEERLGVRLIERTTRRLALTDTGQALYERARPALQMLSEAAAEAAGSQREPRGRVRLTTGAGMATHVFAGVLAEYAQLYPKVTLELDLTDRQVDIVAEGFDLAIRAGELQDSSLVQRKLGVSRNVLVASPAFLGRYGAIETPQALAEAPALLQPGQETWRLERGEERLALELSGPVHVNNIWVLLHLARAGLGIARIPYFLCRDDLASGALQAVLPQWEPAGYPVHVLLPSRRYPSPAVRALLALIEKRQASLFAQ
ncbi:MAG TPA: LysR family transcriptional regulator [Kiloniellales bacterium]|nr:LysR family transcriptional regulator [Kiloniellales bacterium]